MRNVTQQNISDVVIAALSSDIPARNRQILENLIRHIHAFCIETKVTHAELIQACQFLVRAGHISD
ncbi:MAG: hydroxyquinol 1,2-dioxygenase, partial [Mesorhizobium sp.]